MFLARVLHLCPNSGEVINRNLSASPRGLADTQERGNLEMWSFRGDSAARALGSAQRTWRKGDLHILVIDSEPDYVRLLQTSFNERNWRHHVHAVGDAREAMNYIFKFEPFSETPKPHLVILRTDSTEYDTKAFAKLDAMLVEQGIPVILVGCTVDEREAAKSKLESIKFFVIKPFDKEHVRRISRLVQFYSNIS